MRQNVIRRLLVLGMVCGFWPGFAWASADLCFAAVRQAARDSGVPARVLLAIARTETGRGRSGDPWPWSINREGDGHIFETRAEALAFARQSRDAGRPSFDLGCFQVNYRWHGDGFVSLDAMIDPVTNARYAARFLSDLYQELGSWTRAAGAYHSRTPELARAYRARFERQLALLGDDPLPAAPIVIAQADTAPRAPRVNDYPLLQRNTGWQSAGSLVVLGD